MRVRWVGVEQVEEGCGGHRPSLGGAPSGTSLRDPLQSGPSPYRVADAGEKQQPVKSRAVTRQTSRTHVMALA